jgi:hypothetical protein
LRGNRSSGRQGDFDEFKNNFGLAAQRASADALRKFQDVLVSSPEFRN